MSSDTERLVLQMKTVYDLSPLSWTLSGCMPNMWRFHREHMVNSAPPVEIEEVKARVPGSVQWALREAGVIPDWNRGSDSRLSEWVEHRHWIFRAELPDGWFEHGKRFTLSCLGLDYSGWVWLKGKEIGEFRGTHTPHVFDLTPHLQEGGNVLEIIFDLPPRWLGQFGYSSKMTEWKTRFNYTWDWCPRVVQLGIWDDILIESSDGAEIADLDVYADADLTSTTGLLSTRGFVTGDATSTVRAELRSGERTVARVETSAASFNALGFALDQLPIDLWQPNLSGEQHLYDLTVSLIDGDGNVQDSAARRVGFRHIAWESCEGAPLEAAPWVCVVNGQPTFLQGVNFAPVQANYADVTYERYAKLLTTYRDLGVNMIRLNACGFLEKTWFYDLCDELGIMVWQDFPLTSSGLENWAPEDEQSVLEMERIVRSFIKRRKHHASLVAWCGGNELQEDLAGNKYGMGKPCDLTHPMLRRIGEVVREMDRNRHYIPVSPSGPRAGSSPQDFGKGLHHDVHGPYVGVMGDGLAEGYWENDDALFRSEFACAGASPVGIIGEYRGDFEAFPASYDNPYWRRPTSWWIDWNTFVSEIGREPQNLDEYVQWSQGWQARQLERGMRACKARFPRCGGVLLWTGHDTFPIPINTSIIDYHGNPKPAALALAKIWKGEDR